MIEQHVKIHDRHQVEVKLAYKIGDFEKSKAYDLSLYFFIPASMGINPSTYSKRDFFNDLIGHIRLKTPSFLLRDLAFGAGSPLKKIDESFKKLSYRPDSRLVSECERQLKMFCCILKSSLRDHVNAVSTRNNPHDQKEIAEQFLSNITETCKTFRSFRSIINVPTVNKDFFSKFLFADEYVSLTSEFYAFKLLEALKESSSDIFSIYRPKLLAFIRDEVSYRAENGYQSIPSETGDNEILVFRKSVLKKFFESVLFLGVRVRREGSIMEQILFSLAAGLSMVFATGIAFLFQQKFGNLTFPLFVALVISYMFKDRLKELLRLFFNLQIRRFLFDRRQKIFNDPLAKEQIGVCRENCEFVRDNKLPLSVWKLRSRDHITEIENGWVGETVFLYHKNITLSSAWFKFAQDDFHIEGINDILRINFSKFLPRLDEPNKQLWISKGEEYHEINGQRVYHINLIVQYKTGDYLDEKRFRIVLNKEGIKRIEPVNSDRTLLRHVSNEFSKDLFAKTI